MLLLAGLVTVAVLLTGAISLAAVQLFPTRPPCRARSPCPNTGAFYHLFAPGPGRHSRPALCRAAGGPSHRP